MSESFQSVMTHHSGQLMTVSRVNGKRRLIPNYIRSGVVGKPPIDCEIGTIQASTELKEANEEEAQLGCQRKIAAISVFQHVVHNIDTVRYHSKKKERYAQ